MSNRPTGRKRYYSNKKQSTWEDVLTRKNYMQQLARSERAGNKGQAQFLDPDRAPNAAEVHRSNRNVTVDTHPGVPTRKVPTTKTGPLDVIRQWNGIPDPMKKKRKR